MINTIRRFLGLDRQCPHEWSLVSRTYAQPIPNLPTISDPAVLEKALFGVTSYLWECTLCGALRAQEMLGNDEPNQLQKIIDSVEREGMQYIKENGQVYAIAKWVPKVIDSLIPLK